MFLRSYFYDDNAQIQSGGEKTKVIYKVMVSGMEWTVFPDRMCGKH